MVPVRRHKQPHIARRVPRPIQALPVVDRHIRPVAVRLHTPNHITALVHDDRLAPPLRVLLRNQDVLRLKTHPIRSGLKKIDQQPILKDKQPRLAHIRAQRNLRLPSPSNAVLTAQNNQPGPLRRKMRRRRPKRHISPPPIHRQVHIVVGAIQQHIVRQSRSRNNLPRRRKRNAIRRANVEYRRCVSQIHPNAKRHDGQQQRHQ